MATRRHFMGTGMSLGIAGILSSRTAPAFAQGGDIRIGQIGVGHNFALHFKRDIPELAGKKRLRPYAFWYDVPEICNGFGKRGFERVCSDPMEVIRESDVVSIEYPDYNRTMEFAEPALEMGKPVFVDRPFTGTVYSAQRMVDLARKYDAPLMTASSLEFQPQIPEIREWVKEHGPVRSYTCYCPEPMFAWMFPHVINFAHSALGGGIDTAYFSGDYVIEMGGIKSERHSHWYDPGRKLGAAVSLLTYKPRGGEPPIIGMNHIGPGPGPYYLYVFAEGGSHNFVVGDHLDDPKIFMPMTLTLHDFFTNRKPPRPYEAILEQHRAHVATAISRLTGSAVKLDSLGGDDALPYSPSTKDWLDNLLKG